jgi:putative flippase GtrA
MKITKESSLIELLTIGRFAIIGVLATIVHIAIVWVLIAHAGLFPIVANLLAFLVAFILSFSGHYYWTFYSRSDRMQALRRFFVISGSAFVLNNIVLTGLLSIEIITTVMAAIYAAFLIPAFTFILSRLWVFNNKT